MRAKTAFFPGFSHVFEGPFSLTSFPANASRERSDPPPFPTVRRSPPKVSWGAQPAAPRGRMHRVFGARMAQWKHDALLPACPLGRDGCCGRPHRGPRATDTLHASRPGDRERGRVFPAQLPPDPTRTHGIRRLYVAPARRHRTHQEYSNASPPPPRRSRRRRNGHGWPGRRRSEGDIRRGRVIMPLPAGAGCQWSVVSCQL
jgi:hypothetical protein